MTKRRLLFGLVSMLVLLALTVGAAGAQDHKDGLFERIRTVYDVTEAWHKDGANLEKFVQGAIRGGLEALGDRHTNYFAPGEFEQFMNSLEGRFSGIGAYLEQDGNYVVITAPIKNTPAARAGLATGDRILEVDGFSLVGQTTDTAVRLIRGEIGTDVTLKLERPSENRTFTVTVTRAQIDIPEVEYEMLDSQIGYLQLASFGDNSVQEFYQAVDQLKAQGAKGMVLDLRQNGGGYLDAATNIASAFVPAGEPVLWQVGKGSKTSTPSSGRLIGLPLVVLVDKGSASASEILAGAIQDYDAGPLVGVTTFGKGTVQQILTLTGGGGMKVTTAEYLTAKERKVDGIGLTPDYVVERQVADPERTKALEFTRFLRTTSVGLDVLYLQYRLADLGYEPDLDGFFGLRTGRAVTNFAHDNGLITEPMVDGDFMAVLNAKVAEHTASLKLADNQLDQAVEILRERMK